MPIISSGIILTIIYVLHEVYPSHQDWDIVYKGPKMIGNVNKTENQDER